MQLELAGALAVADGRYLVRDEAGAQRVLVVETLGAPLQLPRRRRHAPTAVEPGGAPSPLPLARVTVVRAFEPFDSAARAASWLEEAVAEEETIDALVGEGVALLNRALHAHAVASADPYVQGLAAERAVTVRIGYGSGEEVAAGRFAAAREVDVGAPRSSSRRREAELRPQERVAAVLGGREPIDACETLLLRARSDLDAGRAREAALQLQPGLEALLIELSGALLHPGHEGDMLELGARRGEAREAARLALHGELDAERERQVRELTAICERVLRRRRLLRG